MKTWWPEPFGTYARAHVGGYKATFYRGVVCFNAKRDALSWTVHGNRVEELLAGHPRSTSVYETDQKGPIDNPVPYPNRPGNRHVVLKHSIVINDLLPATDERGTRVIKW